MIEEKLPSNIELDHNHPLYYISLLSQMYVRENCDPFELNALFSFIERYNNKTIKKISYKEYLKTFEGILNVYKLEAEKFWYLLLFVYDYSSEIGKSNIDLITAKEEINFLIDQLADIEITTDEWGYHVSDIHIKSNPELTYKTKTKPTKKITISNPSTLYLLLSFCKEGLSKYNYSSILDSTSQKERTRTKFNYSIHVSCFCRLLKDFIVNFEDINIVKQSLDKDNDNKKKPVKKIYSSIAKFAVFTGIAPSDFSRNAARTYIEQYRETPLWNDNPYYNPDYKRK